MHFDWDVENLTHIAEHDLTAEDVEYIFEHPTLELEYQDWHEQEDRFEEAGMSPSGRIIVVVTTLRGLKVRVVTAYDAPPNVVEEYLEWRGF